MLVFVAPALCVPSPSVPCFAVLRRFFLLHALQPLFEVLSDEILQHMLMIIVVLIPKGNPGGFRGIGLLKMTWKLLERTLNERMSGIKLHDSLYGTRMERDCEAGIMEVKLVQRLAFVEQCPLYGIFTNLRKVFDVMDRGQCLDILCNCGAGDCVMQLISCF